jgi:redox-sensitive bicupin YhaK (pirin superfamily)
MNTKQIERIITPNSKHFVGDGFNVYNIIPGNQGLSMRRMSPFIMMDYNALIQFPPSDVPKGVGVHPHRGFETVTIAYKGKIAHHDSSGGGGVISEGDVQWMTAASGVLHKEYHEEAWSKKGGDFQMVQLWVNLPAKHKMSVPKYQAIPNVSIPKIKLPNACGEIEVIAGELNGNIGAASTFTSVHLYNIRLKAGGKFNFSLPASYNSAILILEGSAMINGESASANQFLLFKNEGEEINVETSTDSILLVLSGEPINEPIAHYGPFVMNTQAEIMEAIDDFNSGKFGFLED